MFKHDWLLIYKKTIAFTCYFTLFLHILAIVADSGCLIGWGKEIKGHQLHAVGHQCIGRALEGYSRPHFITFFCWKATPEGTLSCNIRGIQEDTFLGEEAGANPHKHR